MKKSFYAIAALAAALAFGFAPAADAQTIRPTYNSFNGDQPRQPGKPFRTHAERQVIVDGENQTTTHTFIKEQTYCPPGVAKADCAVKTETAKYKRGQFIPENIKYRDLPASLQAKLDPPSKGLRYIVINNDVYLVRDADRQVMNTVILTD